MGEKFFTGGLMTPPEFDNDLARFTIGTGGLGVWIGVLVLETLGAILQNFPWKGTAGAAKFVDADSCLGCTCAFGSISSSDEEDDEIFLYLFILFPFTGLLGPCRPETWELFYLNEMSLFLKLFSESLMDVEGVTLIILSK